VFLPVVLCDLDAAFLGFELLRRPELAGRPVIIGGDVDARGVVATCSYEARAFGVHSAMSAAQAARRCPQAVWLPVDMPYYREMSGRFRAVATRGVAGVQPVALDEVYLDLGGQRHVFGAAEAFCRDLRERLQEELGLRCSIGAAAGPRLAKMACELWAKPGGIALLAPADAAARLAPQPVGVLPGVGEASAERLSRHGLRSCGDLAAAPPALVAALLGSRARDLRALAGGHDDQRVTPPGPPKSLSVEETFPRDLDAAGEEARHVLIRLAWQLGGRLARAGMAARRVGVRWRTAAFVDGSSQHTYAGPLRSRLDLRDGALALWAERAPRLGRIRLLGVEAGGLGPRQPGVLPPDRLERVLADLEAGGTPLVPASLLSPSRSGTEWSGPEGPAAG
jgi:DNA polymerase-4